MGWFAPGGAFRVDPMGKLAVNVLTVTASLPALQLVTSQAMNNLLLAY